MTILQIVSVRADLIKKMSNLKKILITTESREVFILRINSDSQISGYCAACAEDVPLLTLDEAVSFSALFTREMIRRIECGAIHSVETASGHLLVCRNSLNNFSKGE